MSMFVNVTVFVSPALITGIFFRSTIGFGDFWIVSVTPTLNSWKSPESSTETWKARSVDAVISLPLAATPDCSVFPSGNALTGPRALPCLPLGLPPVAAPWTRCQTVIIACELARSGFGKISESGTGPTSVTFCRASSCCVGWRK